MKPVAADTLSVRRPFVRAVPGAAVTWLANVSGAAPVVGTGVRK